MLVTALFINLHLLPIVQIGQRQSWSAAVLQSLAPTLIKYT